MSSIFFCGILSRSSEGEEGSSRLGDLRNWRKGEVSPVEQDRLLTRQTEGHRQL